MRHQQLYHPSGRIKRSNLRSLLVLVILRQVSGALNYNQMTKLSAVCMSTSDDYMTPPYAWENIARFLPKDKVCYEPFYGDGKSGEVLRGLGLEVIHEDTDFFTNAYDFDYICTNPPFSKLKQIFAELKAIGKPFIVLCPCTTLTTKYFSKHFADDIQIIVPPKRIHFEKLVDGKPIENYKSRCNFDCLYYCWKMDLPRDLVWLI